MFSFGMGVWGDQTFGPRFFLPKVPKNFRLRRGISTKVFKLWIFLFPDDLETNEAAIERKSLYTRPYTMMSPWDLLNVKNQSYPGDFQKKIFEIFLIFEKKIQDFPIFFLWNILDFPKKKSHYLKYSWFPPKISLIQIFFFEIFLIFKKKYH